MDSLNLAEDGAVVIKQCLPEPLVQQLRDELQVESGNTRDAFRLASVLALAKSPVVRRQIATALGEDCFAVRAVLFNKNPELNWKVSWHQDCFIGVRRKVNVLGWGPWSTKLGVAHVRPPVSVLREMLTIRIHLDDCGLCNGPLCVLRSTHKLGVLSDAEIGALPTEGEIVLSVDRGDAILMRPLIVHASSVATSPNARRVIHIEFAAEDLPNGLEWNYRIGAQA